MKTTKAIIITATVLLICAAAVFLYLQVPGTFIYDEINFPPESRVTIVRNTVSRNRLDDNFFFHTTTEYTLTPEQTELLRELIRTSTFRRVRNTAFMRSLQNIYSYSRYSITIRNPQYENVVIDLSWRYLQFLTGAPRSWRFRVNYTMWHETLEYILSLELYAVHPYTPPTG